jgi:hypothetical protein
MADTPRNIAFPVFLLVILAFLLLLFIMVWLWGSTDAPSAPTPDAQTGIEERGKTRAPDDQTVGRSAEEIGQSAEATDTQDLPAITGTLPERITAVAEETRSGRTADEPKGAHESSQPAPVGGSGGSAGSPTSASRQETSRGASGGAAPGSTFTAIPSGQPQSPQAAAQEVDPEPENEQEIPIEEEDIPEPLSEPTPSEDNERPEREPQEEPPDSTPIVQLIPTVTELAVGDHLAVVVMISGASDVGHVPFHLLYNSQVLQFEYGEEGGFFGSDGRQTAFFAAPAGGGGGVVVGLSRLGGGDGISGGGELCVLHFTAIAPGPAAFAFSREKVRDSANQILLAVFLPAAVTVRQN